MNSSHPLASRPLKCALCGLGDWAWKHVALVRETPGFDLVAISSRSDAAWQRAKQDLPGVHLYRHHTEMLATTKPSLVIITTPHHLHASMTIEALQAGAHVIVEKPMATSLRDGKAMIAAAKAAGKMLAIYHNRRFDPWLLAALRIVQEGKLGRLVEMNALWPQPIPYGGWRMKKLESGGLFFDVGAHAIDYLTAFAAAKPTMVSGHVHRVPGRDPLLNEDHAVAQVQFENGIRGRVYTSEIDLAPARRYHLVGEKGTLVDEWNWGGGEGTLFSKSTDGKIESTRYSYGSEGGEPGGRLLYRNIAAHLFDGAPLIVTPEAALQHIAVLLAAERSAALQGQWVDVAQFIAQG